MLSKNGVFRKFLLNTVFIVVVLFGVIYSIMHIILLSEIRDRVVISAGERVPSVSAFFRKPNLSLYFKGDFRGVNLGKTGEYKVKLSTYGMSFHSILLVKDDKAPFLKLANKKTEVGKSLRPEDFVEYLSDDSKVRLSFKSSPDFTEPHTQRVHIIATDASGNVTEKTAKLEVVYDSSIPHFEGIEDKHIFIGDTVSYRKGVRFVDGSNTYDDFEVDTSHVNTGEAGVYPVYYIKNSDGYKDFHAVSRVFVKESNDEAKNHKEASELAGEIVKKIITNDMTYLQKLRAIYDYVSKNIAYSPKERPKNRFEAAVNALKTKRGDCYYIYAATMALIEKIGGASVPVERSKEANSKHMWTLVHYRGSWYHFDPTNFANAKFDAFMKSDPEIESLTKKYQKVIPYLYVYDKSNYPKAATEPISEDNSEKNLIVYSNR